MLKQYYPYILLVLAIIAEVIGTSLLKDTDQFRRWNIALVMIGFYAVSFYLLSIVVKTIPVGIAYALWSGLGTVFIVLIAIYKYQEIPNLPTILGLAMIVGGVVMVNLYSDTAH
ncbi:MAG: multidrug efflux SMR transporter [Alphaproteobacteria bacterium]|nr:multidrug efflux SMR transporter [Alphaproteobacteria bacterium]